MNKTIVAIAISLVAINALGSEWQYVGGNDSQSSSMDFSSIASVGRYRKAWVQTTYSSPQVLNQYTGKAYSSDRVLYYFDCAAKTLGSIQRVRYEKGDAQGGVVGSTSVKFNPASLDDVVPDSVGETFLALACGTPSDRQKVRAANKTPFDKLMERASPQGIQANK